MKTLGVLARRPHAGSYERACSRSRPDGAERVREATCVVVEDEEIVTVRSALARICDAALWSALHFSADFGIWKR